MFSKLLNSSKWRQTNNEKKNWFLLRIEKNQQDRFSLYFAFRFTQSKIFQVFEKKSCFSCCVCSPDSNWIVCVSIATSCKCLIQFSEHKKKRNRSAEWSIISDSFTQSALSNVTEFGIEFECLTTIYVNQVQCDCFALHCFSGSNSKQNNNFFFFKLNCCMVCRECY